MDESESACMESLTGACLHAVGYELAVGSRALAAEELVAAIAGVVEEGVALVSHVDADLVGASGLEHTLDEGSVGKVLEDFVMSDGMLAGGIVGGEDGHLQAVLGVAADVALDASRAGEGYTPDEGIVFALGSLVEELATEVGLGIGGLGDDKQTGGVLVDAVRPARGAGR